MKLDWVEGGGSIVVLLRTKTLLEVEGVGAKGSSCRRIKTHSEADLAGWGEGWGPEVDLLKHGERLIG